MLKIIKSSSPDKSKASVTTEKPAKAETVIFNPVANANRAAGSPAAGALLMRVAYWMPKARVKRDGTMWVAKSAEEWAADAGLSLQQYRDALKRLKDRELVETQQAPFAGKNVTHLRLTEKAAALLNEREPVQPKPVTMKTNVVPMMPPKPKGKITKEAYLSGWDEPEPDPGKMSGAEWLAGFGDDAASGAK